MKIALRNMESAPRPIRTPAGVIEKHFEATVTDLDSSGISIVLEIELRTEDQKNPNKILLKRLEIIDLDSSGKGITAPTLRSFKLKEIQDKCLLAAINEWYPHTKPKKQTFKLPSPDEIKRIDLIASIMQKYGGTVATETIQKELQKLEISMNIGTINNYKTKVKKANLLFNQPINEFSRPIVHPGIEGQKIEEELIKAIIETRPPDSPTIRDKKAKDRERKRKEAEKRRQQINMQIREDQKNGVFKPKQMRKEGK